MKVDCRGWSIGRIVAMGVLLALTTVYAQKKPSVSTPADTRNALVEKARVLETRGRPDLAIQLWQQILLSDSGNVQALAGVAKDYKLMGKADKAAEALNQLRKVSPNDPNISKIESTVSTKGMSDQLRQAGELARQGKAEEAMRVYRSIYDDHPPDGDIALAYYQTLYGTANGKVQAIAGMRALAKRNPGDSRVAIALGTMLTYDARTRAEGVRILQGYSKDSTAATALRQALVWNENNPSSVSALRQYLKDHPQDSELTGYLKENEAKLARMNSGIARNAEERLAFAALNARRLEEAQTRFLAILEKDPLNPRAAAGMGFLRMQQNNFGGAISYLTQAEENGYATKTVTEALATSRFWYTMGEAAQALEDNQFDVAAAKYQAALVMQPRSQDALQGLAGLLMKEQQYDQAAGVYEQLVQVHPNSADAWKGLFLAHALNKQEQKALDVSARFPASVKTELAKDPEFLRQLASIYQTLNRPEDQRRTLMLALSLPYPDNGAGLSVQTRLQYAGILVEAKRYSQAVEMYSEILRDEPDNFSAWVGLVSSYHEINQDSQAIAEVEKMPSATYQAALADPGFLGMLASVYQQNKQYEVAQQLLERSAKVQTARGGQLSVAFQLQLAGVYLQQNNTAKAYELYRQLLTRYPNRADAWKGLIDTLQTTGRSAEALQELAQIPPAVRKELELNFEFVQTEASIYAAAGDTAHALECMNRVNAHYSALKTQPPATIQIQNAWLLYNTKNDRDLYPVLMTLGSRTDLTDVQRENIQTIWANWSVRRAATAMANGNSQRAVSILEAAALAFPNNPDVRKAVAGGYAKVGRSKDAVTLYQTIPMQDASSGDFQGAVGAALSANDKTQAETWLRMALARYPHDPSILQLAARFEEARGDKQRAADYLRSSLAAMPQVSPTDRLAHQLVYPDVDVKTRKATTPADLQNLLNPENESYQSQKTIKLPPLPAYGVDPYAASAPVLRNNQTQQTTQQKQWVTAPATTEIPATSAPKSNPVVPYVPQAQTGGLPSALQLSGNEQSEEIPSRHTSSAKDQTSMMGRMQLPKNKTKIKTTPVAPEVPSATLETAQPLSAWTTQTIGSSSDSRSISSSTAGLQITSKPMNDAAAQAQALFAEQTDGQIRQGTAIVHAIPSASVEPVETLSTGTNIGVMAMTEYKAPAPKTTQAASAARQQQTTQQVQPVVSQPAQATTAANCPTVCKKTKKATAAVRKAPVRKKQTVPTLATAPGVAVPQTTKEQPAPYIPAAIPAPVTEPVVVENSPTTNSTPSSTGVTDEQLQLQNLPPLRGSWGRVKREKQTVTSPRDLAEEQLRSIESSFSGWVGGSGLVSYRSGDLGYDRLTAFEAPFELSVPLGVTGRFTIVATPVFLDSGQADGNSQITVREQTTSSTTLEVIAQPIGTLTATNTTIPVQQNSAGIGGEVQLAFKNFAIAGGYTPYGFLVSNVTGRMQWNPGAGPFTFTFSRDAVKDTQLSYAGLRDPAGLSLGTVGQVWGGVIANQGNVQYVRGNAESGFYLGGGGQFLRGYNVLDNSRIHGNGGAYWRVMTSPENGTLNIGANFFGMHYAHNQAAFTHGMGGYFSPQAYFLANAPITWTGHSGTAWHYNIQGSLGIQAFQSDLTPLWPLAGDAALLTSMEQASLPAKTSVSGNYDFQAKAAYQISPHWFAGGYFSGNNARNYKAVSAGFFVRYVFREQPSTVTRPTGLFPTEGLRPYEVP